MMKTNHLKLAAVTVFAMTAATLTAFDTTPTRVLAAKDDDVATVYKTKCASCHSPKAEKAYDPAKPIEEQVEIILKGKKGEKPPNMPAFEAKGITPEQAKALAEYMKSLRTPAN